MYIDYSQGHRVDVTLKQEQDWFVKSWNYLTRLKWNNLLLPFFCPMNYFPPFSIPYLARFCPFPVSPMYIWTFQHLDITFQLGDIPDLTTARHAAGCYGKLRAWKCLTRFLTCSCELKNKIPPENLVYSSRAFQWYHSLLSPISQ